MRVAIYSPYLDTVGGGEKYMLTIAEGLSKVNQVDVLLDPHLLKIGAFNIKQKSENLHNLDLSRVNFIQAPIGNQSKSVKRALFLRKYDLLFYNSDGSVFYSTAKKNVIHYQIPFQNPESKGAWNKVKLKSWDLAIYNSEFTKEIIEKNIHIKGRVVYPPVDIDRFSKALKKKIILNVGRFVGTGVKKQHILLEGFERAVKDKLLPGWSFHLAGGMMEGDKKYFEELRIRAKGLPVFFYPNIPYPELTHLYNQSSIYWHGMGYDEGDPKKQEHFGIVTVEAMAAGLVPIVINKGGQKEIVTHGLTGLLWNSLDELVEMTEMVSKDSKLREKIIMNARKRSRAFSKDEFVDNIIRISHEK
jgi:glycosyltransferase involved in cell wall biosynthesis